MQVKLWVQKVIVVGASAVPLFLVSILYTQAAAVDVAKGFVAKINQVILFPLITLMMGIAFVVFLYGGFEYVMNADNDSARQTGARHLLWGVIGFLVMVSAMAVLSIAANTFGLDGELRNAKP